ncbi:leucine-rich repeat and coiled-coil domain-containing protein 1-like [Mizuhopecten yessoensis]|uniref:leucine-rich repeat and coiled-coil domain-containing protein 1-like n=1 Tax=Mizuhopecten yessoensis TaxID=6573 RepID=UPI000B45CB11|nr:leucine-rich repeat and coiled-coil domain-containing protein 1-like [Mizuhopecten yessoensis]
MVDTESHELCLIDSGISSLQQVPLRTHLHSLNLHGNYIQVIDNLSHLHSLKHLDLSSNQINFIDGLDRLDSLRTLNLSCNFLTDVRGLAGLRSLVKVNLSYNQITNIFGFKSVTGPNFKLTHIELQGNKLSSSQHVSECLSGLVNLRQLNLNADGSSNPLCNQAGYRVNILGSLPQVQVLDNIGRDGQRATGLDVLADIPGLEDYMDYLLSNSESASNSMVEGKPLDLVTPKIDKALEIFKRKTLQSSSDTSNAQVSESDLDRSTDKQNISGVSEQNRRLRILEQQIANLLQPSRSKAVYDEQSSSPGSVTKLVAERDVRQTDESDDAGSGNSQHDKKSKGRKGKRSRRSRIPSYCKTTASSRAKVEPPETSSSAIGEDQLGPATHEAVLRQPSAYCVTDQQMREDVQSTYVQLMQELEKERERRWKAEQASKKLVDHIKSLQTKAKDGDQLKDTAIEATTRLKQALTNEREAKLRLQDDLDRTKVHLQEGSRQLSVAKEAEESLKRSLRNLEEVTAKMERETLQQQTHEQKKTHDAQMRASALTRELEMLKVTAEKQKGQIHQLQELLANREQQHRDEMKQCVRPNSQEMDSLIQQEKRQAEKQYESELRTQHDKNGRQFKDLSEKWDFPSEREQFFGEIVNAKSLFSKQENGKMRIENLVQ